MAIRIAGFICLTLGLLFFILAAFATWHTQGFEAVIHEHDPSKWRVWWAYVVVLTPGFLMIILAELLDPGPD